MPTSHINLLHYCAPAIVILEPLVNEVIDDIFLDASDDENLLSIFILDFYMRFINPEQGNFFQYLLNYVKGQVLENLIFLQSFNPDHHVG